MGPNELNNITINKLISVYQLIVLAIPKQNIFAIQCWNPQQTNTKTKKTNKDIPIGLSLFKEKDLIKVTDENINYKQNEILSLTKEIEGIDADIRLLKERQKYKRIV